MAGLYNIRFARSLVEFSACSNALVAAAGGIPPKTTHKQVLGVDSRLGTGGENTDCSAHCGRFCVWHLTINSNS